MSKRVHLFIYTRTVIALFLCVTLFANLQAAQRIIPQLKGTYTPFQEGVLAEHKGLSPLMGAIAWHSGWIAGFYTWGPGQRVEVARARAGGATTTPAAAAGGPATAAVLATMHPHEAERKQFKLVNADKTRELLEYLFIDVTGDIQPTKLKTNPLFYIIKQSIDDPKSDYLRTFFGWIMLPQEARISVVHLLNKFSTNTTKDQRSRMLAMISGEGSTERILPSKLIKFVTETQSALKESPEQKKTFLAFAQWLSEGTDELKGIVSFLQKINESFAECGPDKSYPAFVTEQILSAYWYAVQFTDQMRTHADGARTIDDQMELALPHYMQAVGIDDFRLTAYDIKLLVDTTKTCPLSIDELVLASALFEKVNQIISLVGWSHFNYRDAPDSGNCVETMLLNFFNFILCDPETKTYRLSQLPPTLAGSINTNLRNFYTNPENTNPANSSNPTVINEWLETISGLPSTTPEGSPEYIKYRSENSYTYKGVTKTNKFVLASEEHTVLAVINYLLGTKATNFEELGPLLSTEDRKIEITTLASGGFKTTIDLTSIDFNVRHDHSFAAFATVCELYGKVISVKDLDWLSYCLAAHVFAENTPLESVQWIRYLLYGTGKNDYNFLASALLSAALAMHAYKAVPDWLDTIFEKLTAFEQHTLDPFKNCLNEMTNFFPVFNTDKKFVDLVIKAMVSKDEKFDDPRTATQNIILFNFFLDKGFDVNTKNSAGETALLCALRNGRHDMAERLVPKMSKDTINAQDSSGKTALIYALEKRYQNIAEFIANETFPEVANTQYGNYKVTALMLAASNGLIIVVDQLLSIMSPEAINAQDKSGNTALIYALENNHKNIAEHLVPRMNNAAMNTQNESGNTALICALEKGYHDVAKFIANGTSREIADKRDRYGDTALIYALKQGYQDIANQLIPIMSKPAINIQNYDGKTALIYAIEANNAAIVEKLLPNMSQDAVNARDRYGQTALMYALEHNYIVIAKLLIPRINTFDTNKKLMILGKIGIIDGIEQLASKMSDAIINAQDEGGKTALMYAAMSGNKDIVEQLLSNMSDDAVNAQDGYGDTALIYATIGSNKGIVEALLSNMSDDAINVQNHGKKTALIYAIEKGDQDIARLIANKTSTDAANTQYGYDEKTALMLAVENGSLAVVDQLLPKMSEFAICALDRHNKTALMYALENNHSVIAEHIKLTIKSQTAILISAARTGDKDTVDRILSEISDAAINAQDQYGRTALMYVAAASGSTKDIVELLLSKMNGEAIGAQDYFGFTALMYAKEKGDDEIIKLIENTLREKTSAATTSTK